MALPNRGRVYLFSRGLTQAEIARQAGVSRQYVSACMAGRKSPSKKLVEVACRLTELPAPALFEGLDEDD